MLSLQDITSVQGMQGMQSYEEMRRRLTPSPDIMAGSAEERAAIQEAAEAFESYFIQMMLREMRNTLSDEDGLIPKSRAEQIFTEMLDEEWAKEAARGRGIGLAQVIVQQMTRDAYAANVR